MMQAGAGAFIELAGGSTDVSQIMAFPFTFNRYNMAGSFGSKKLNCTSVETNACNDTIKWWDPYTRKAQSPTGQVKNLEHHWRSDSGDNVDVIIGIARLGFTRFIFHFCSSAARLR